MTTTTAATRPAALRTEGLSKTFPGTRALSDLTIEIGAGEVHALAGSNGSGKSTFIKLLAGYHQPDPGYSAWFGGQPLDLDAPGADRPPGLRFIHQDLGLVLELDAVDNFGLKCGYATRRGSIDWREQARRTQRALSRFGIGIDIHQPLSQAAPVERTVLAIAAAIEGWDEAGGLLVLDEPTAALPHAEVEVLFQIIGEVVAAGASILYVSHRLDEIFTIADTVSVLRAGRLVETRPVEGLTGDGIAALMAGADVDTDVRPQPFVRRPDSVPAIEAVDLRGRYLRGVDLTVHPGEIVGVAGLLGSGREELPYVLAGARADSATGRIRAGGEPWRTIERGGFQHALVPADRLAEGIIGELPVQDNVALPALRTLGRHGLMVGDAESRMAVDVIERVGLVPADPSRLMSTLSGGNQQKVVVGRWLTEERPVLILSEPTAGVDIAARMALFRLLIEAAEEGLGMVVASSDVHDLIHLCTRVIVLREGVVTRELEQDEVTESTLLRVMEGLES
ncbi:MAG: sugar ABC transporter ATP-binding protein [Patulibacter sp.]